MRLDRWFRQHVPALKHGMLEKLLRKGQIRVDGGRAKASTRLEKGQQIRIPPLDIEKSEAPPRKETKMDAAARAYVAQLQDAIVYQDSECAVLNKPAGLAVQGGPGNDRNLDALLPFLFPGKEARLVHRLDKDTSGVLLIAFGRAAAARLTRAFRDRAAKKLYWAVVVGEPPRRRGRIDLPVAKRGGAGAERMVVIEEDEARGGRPDDAKRAATRFATLDHAGKQASWLALMPLTGRTHQLRVHMAAVGHPILGDGKYGGREASVPGLPNARRLHLHARRLIIPREGRPPIDAVAPLSPHIAETFDALGFGEPADPDPFDLDAR